MFYAASCTPTSGAVREQQAAGRGTLSPRHACAGISGGRTTSPRANGRGFNQSAREVAAPAGCFFCGSCLAVHGEAIARFISSHVYRVNRVGFICAVNEQINSVEGNTVPRDPFVIDGPTCLSFSGGRTSAYMLRRTLDANPASIVDRFLSVCFANTGKEEEATLRFVRDCGERWHVPIKWLEYTGDDAAMYRVTSFATAARDGEPFEALIRRRQFLPNPVSRFCTSELKIRTMHRFIRDVLGWDEWDQFIGIRADEQRRVAKIRARGTSTETKDETMCMPLADAGVTVQDVGAFWATQPFNLELATHNGRTLAGNCDLCFLKPPRQRASLIAERPQRAVWWVRMEALALSSSPAGARFCKDGPAYADLAAQASNQVDFIGHDEEAIACFCGD